MAWELGWPKGKVTKTLALGLPVENNISLDFINKKAIICKLKISHILKFAFKPRLQIKINGPTLFRVCSMRRVSMLHLQIVFRVPSIFTVKIEKLQE